MPGVGPAKAFFSGFAGIQYRQMLGMGRRGVGFNSRLLVGMFDGTTSVVAEGGSGGGPIGEGILQDPEAGPGDVFDPETGMGLSDPESL